MYIAQFENTYILVIHKQKLVFWENHTERYFNRIAYSENPNTEQVLV